MNLIIRVQFEKLLKLNLSSSKKVCAFARDLAKILNDEPHLDYQALLGDEPLDLELLKKIALFQKRFEAINRTNLTNEQITTVNAFFAACFAHYRSETVPQAILNEVQHKLDEEYKKSPPPNSTKDFDPSERKRIDQEQRRFTTKMGTTFGDDTLPETFQKNNCIHALFRYAVTEKLEDQSIELPASDEYYMWKAEFMLGKSLVDKEIAALDSTFETALSSLKQTMETGNYPQSLIKDFEKLYKEQKNVHYKTLVLQMVKRTKAFIEEPDASKKENYKAILLHDANLFRTSFVGLNVFGALMALIGALSIGAGIGIGVLSMGTAVIPAAALGVAGVALMTSGIGFFCAKQSFQKPVKQFTRNLEAAPVSKI